MAVYERFDVVHDAEDDDDLPAPVRQRINARVMEIGHVATFLDEKDVSLSAETMAAFMLALESGLVAALSLLKRRSGGDYFPDRRLERFANGAAQCRRAGPRIAPR